MSTEKLFIGILLLLLSPIGVITGIVATVKSIKMYLEYKDFLYIFSCFCMLLAVIISIYIFFDTLNQIINTLTK